MPETELETLERRARHCVTHHTCDCWQFRALKAEAEVRELRALLAAALPGDDGRNECP